MNKPVLTKEQLEEQDDIRYNELLEHEKKVKAFTKRNNEAEAKRAADAKLVINKPVINKPVKKYESINFDSDSD